MAAQEQGRYGARPKSKTPAERSVEFDAVQARLKAEAAARRQAQAPPSASQRKR